MRTVKAGALLVAASLACGTIEPAPGSPAPRNSCTTSSDCTRYAPASGAPLECTAGACELPESPATTLIAVISLPAPPAGTGATYVMTYGTLAKDVPPTSASGATADCGQGICAALPPADDETGNLVVVPAAARLANWNLGDANVSLPVKATFRVVSTAGALRQDAMALGLPTMPVTADTIVNPNPGGLAGPGGGPDMLYRVVGQLPALDSFLPYMYERTLTPLPPFDQAFPPDVDLEPAGSSLTQVTWKGFDTTIGTGNGVGRDNPKFTFKRADGGPLDGWTAYLRDQGTLRPFSQVAQLVGQSQLVTLLTNHHPAGAQADALTGAQLVLSPPAGTAVPAWIFTPIAGTLGSAGTAPRLPPPVQVTPQILTVSGGPASADLAFDAVDVCRYSATGTTPEHDVLSATHDFSFHVTASTGQPVDLPLGNYRLTIVPRDTTSPLTVVTPFTLADSNCNPTSPTRVTLGKLSEVNGVAQLVDGTPLADAIVDAIPKACADAETDAACLPRPATTVTSPAGAYHLSLDPGVYWLRIRPVDGSAWPWTVQTFSTAAPPAPRTVPAPLYAGLRLYDDNGDPLVDALVRVYANPASDVPYEIGRAIVASDGHFDMFLDPTAQ